MSEKKQPNVRFAGFADDWEQRKLGTIVKVQGGGTPSSNNPLYWGGDIDWFTPTEVSNNGYLNGSKKKITNTGLKKSSAKLMPEGTILMTSRAGVGAMGILTRPAATNQGFQSLIPSEQIPPYFLYSMQPIISKIANRLASGSTFTEISGKTVEKISITIPRKKQEKVKIGNLFLKLDQLVASNQRKLDQLKELKKLFMQKIFDQEWRFKGFNDPWEQCKFESLVNRVSEVSDDKALPRVEFRDIVSGEGRLNNDVMKKDDARKGIKFCVHDVLFGKLRPYLKNWLYADFDGVALGDFWVFREYKISNKFIYVLIQSKKYQSVANLSTGTKMPRSDWKTVAGASFFVPKLNEESELIGAFFQHIDKIIASNQKKVDQLKKIKKWFMQNMFV